MVKPREYKTLFHLEFVLDKVTYYESQKVTNDETTVTVSHLGGQTLSVKETQTKARREYEEEYVTNIIFNYGKSGLFSAIPSQLEKQCEVDLKILRQSTLGEKISEGHCKIILGGMYSDLLKFSPNEYVKRVEDARIFCDRKGNIKGCITFILKLSFYGKVKTAESECDFKILRFESNTEEEIILQMIPGDSKANWAMYNYTPRKKDMPNFDRYEDTFNFEVSSTASKQNENEETKSAFPQVPPKLPDYIEKAFTDSLKKKAEDTKQPAGKGKPSKTPMNLETVGKPVIQYMEEFLLPQNYYQFCENFPGADRYFENLAKANTERLVQNLKDLTALEEQQAKKHQTQASLYQNQLHSIYPQGNGIIPHMFANNPANYAININQNSPLYAYGVPNPFQNPPLYPNPYNYYSYAPFPPPYGLKTKGYNLAVPHYPSGTGQDDVKNLTNKTNDKYLTYHGKPNGGFGPGRPPQQLYSNRQNIVPQFQPNYPLGNNLRLLYRNAQPNPVPLMKTYGYPVGTVQDKPAVQTKWIVAKPKELSPPPLQSVDNKLVQKDQTYEKGRHHNLPAQAADGTAKHRRSQQTSRRHWNGQDQMNGGPMTDTFAKIKQENPSPLPHNRHEPSFSNNKRNSKAQTKK